MTGFRPSALAPLLQQVLAQGWTASRQRQFLNDYGPLLRRSILYQLRSHFGPVGLQAVGRYLDSLRQGDSMTRHEGIDGTHFDLATNVWQDVLVEVFRSDLNQSLLGKYVAFWEGREAQVDEDPSASFEGFMRQNVRYKFLDNLPHKLSQKEIFDRIVDVEQPQRRAFYIREARHRHADAVHEYLRQCCTGCGEAELNNAVDYFFEKFLLSHYPTLRDDHSAQQLRGKTLELLLKEVSEADCEAGARHRAEVHGVSGRVETVADEVVERVGEVDEIPVGAEVDVYWDRLLRCDTPDLDQIEREAALQPDEAAALCWACAKLKGDSPRKDTRENVLAFIAFYCSQRGPQREANEMPGPDGLCLEALSGLYLRWEEDICKRIFTKNIRKDRVMEMVSRALTESPFAHLLQGGGAGA